MCWVGSWFLSRLLGRRRPCCCPCLMQSRPQRSYLKCRKDLIRKRNNEEDGGGDDDDRSIISHYIVQQQTTTKRLQQQQENCNHNTNLCLLHTTRDKWWPPLSAECDCLCRWTTITTQNVLACHHPHPVCTYVYVVIGGECGLFRTPGVVIRTWGTL